MTIIYQVRLFNGPVITSASGMETKRFRSHKVGALLAYLALNLGRPCPREELYEALWPEEDATLAANRFRVTLASLRKQLEPGSIAFGTVLDVSEPGRVRLRAETVSCDVAECDRLLRVGKNKEAAILILGPLLPGFYEDWALDQQIRFQLIADDLLAYATPSPHRNTYDSPIEIEEPPPKPSTPSMPTRNRFLPLYLTRFFGRESERRTLLEQLESNRLVSLIGMGGIGKTRLATETNLDWKGDSLFVSLVPLSDSSSLYHTVLKSLEVSPHTDSPLLEQIIRVLNRRGELVLILDNAEHLIEAVAEMAIQLLEGVSKLRILVTSRQRLDIPGETVILLAPLKSPEISGSFERLMEFDAVSLFTDRAKNARPDFDLTVKNSQSVTEICRLLEGHPLALELAAVRITSQTPQQIALSLKKRLTDLKTKQHGVSPRHQSIVAVIQASLDLLSVEQRDFFLALSVFQGGWTIEGAKAVTLCDKAEEYLNHLTISSLIGAQEAEDLGSMRYSMLETLKQFASERLSPEKRKTYLERHTLFFITIAERTNEEDFRVMVQAEEEHENLLSALNWSLRSDRGKIYRLLCGILNHWGNSGYHRLALEWIARVNEDVEIFSSDLYQGIFRIYLDVGRYDDAEKIVRQAMEKVQDSLLPAWSQICLGVIRDRQGRWDEAIEFSLNALREVRILEGDYHESSLYVRLVHSHLAEAFNNRAIYAPDLIRSESDFREAETYARVVFADIDENSRLYSSYHCLLMNSLWGQNREAEGDECFVIALRTALIHKHYTSLMNVMEAGAFRFVEKGELRESVRFFSAVAMVHEKMGYHSPLHIEARTRQRLASLRERLGVETFDRDWKIGINTLCETLVSTTIETIFPRKKYLNYSDLPLIAH